MDLWFKNKISVSRAHAERVLWVIVVLFVEISIIAIVFLSVHRLRGGRVQFFQPILRRTLTDPLVEGYTQGGRGAVYTLAG